MNFNIPARFQLGGITINVSRVKQVTGASSDCDGMAFYAESKIELLDSDTHSKEYKDWVFLHELVHHICNSMEENDLRKNEQFVSRFATFLYQAIKTMEDK